MLYELLLLFYLSLTGWVWVFNSASKEVWTIEIYFSHEPISLQNSIFCNISQSITFIGMNSYQQARSTLILWRLGLDFHSALILRTEKFKSHSACQICQNIPFKNEISRSSSIIRYKLVDFSSSRVFHMIHKMKFKKWAYST